MGRRFYLGLAILGFLLAAGLLVTWGMSALHRPMAESLSAAADAALTGDWEQAVSLAQRTHGQWVRYRSLVACVADHTPMDQIEDLLSEMTVFLQGEETVHFAACCRELSAAFHAMADAHALTLSNFL